MIAENAYGGQSEPLECSVRVSGDNSFRTFFTRLADWFRTLKDFFKHLFW